MEISCFRAASNRGAVPDLLKRTVSVAKTRTSTKSYSACAILLSLLSISASAAGAASVKDYGAKGDGISDDTAAIQNAVNATHSGSLVFPAGTYKLTKTITLLSNVTYQGQSAKLQGNGAWIMQTAWSGANETISGFIFDNGGLCISGTVTGLTLSGNTFQNLTNDYTGGNWTQGNAVFSGSGGLRASKISGNTFKNLLVGNSPEPNGNIDNGGNGALWFYGLDATSIDHNTFDHVGEGIKVCLNNNYQSNNIYIGYNTFTNIHRMGMEIQGAMGCGASAPAINGPDTYNTVIEYNSFTSPLDPYWWTYPISLANPAPYGGSGAIIRYNYLVSALPKYGMNGPNGYGIEAGSASLQIYGNTVAGPWGTGITYDGSPNSTIHDNFLCGIVNGAKAGIRYETAPSANVSVTNNTSQPNSCPASLPNPIKSSPPPPADPPSAPGPTQTGPVANGIYGVTNSYSGLKLDDPGLSVSSVQIIQWPANGGENQNWKFTFNGSGYYTIENAFSGLYLTDNGRGMLFQALQANNDSQLWSLKLSGSNYVIVNKQTGKAADDPGFSPNQGTGILTWAVNGGTNQAWTIK